MGMLAGTTALSGAGNAAAQAAASNTLNLQQITDTYQTFAAQLGGQLLPLASAMFWALAAMDIVAALVAKALEEAEPVAVVLAGTRKLTVAGVMYLILSNYQSLATGVIQWLRGAANSAVVAGGGVQDLAPTTVFVDGVSLSIKIMGGIEGGIFAAMSPQGILLVIAALVIIVTFAWLTALMVLALVEAWISAAAVLMLGAFSGASFTREIALNAYRIPLAAGMKLMGVQIMVGLGEHLLSGYANQVNSADGTTLSNLAIEIVGCALVFLALVQVLPNTLASAAGGSFSGNPLASVTTKAAGAVAAGATDLVATAAGGAWAGAEAWKKTGEEIDAAGGRRSAGAMLSGTARELGDAFARDVGGRLSGRSRFGVTTGRMPQSIAESGQAAQLRREAVASGEDAAAGSTIIGPPDPNPPQRPTPPHSGGPGPAAPDWGGEFGGIS